MSDKNDSAGSISTKEWWNLCKFIYTGKNNDHSVPPLIYNNNIIITKDAHKAEAFTDYFHSISRVEYPHDDINMPIIPTEYELSNIMISENDVKDVLLDFKISKACGLDMVNHRLLKESANVISQPLAHIFNKCLNIEKFPTQWKMANIVQIHKGNVSICGST